MSDKKSALWLAVILLLSFLIRFLLISLGPYHSDCLYLAIQAEKIIQTGQMQYLQSSGLPLTAVLGALFVGLFKILNINDPVFAVNFMSVLFGSLSVVAMFFCVKQLTDIRTACISAVLLMLNPLMIGLSIFGNSHMPATFFLLTGIFYLLRYPQSQKNSDLVYSGLWLGCMAAARLQDFGVMIIPLLFLGLSQWSGLKPGLSAKLKYMTIPVLSCLFVISIAYFPKFFLKGLPTAEQSFSGYFKTNLTDHLQGMSFVLLENILKDIVSIFSPIERLLMITGVFFLLVRKQWKKILFLLLWFIVPILIFGCLKFFVFRLLIITFIPLIILESYFVSHLSGMKSRWSKLIFPVLFIFVLINVSRYYPMFLFRHQNALLPEFFEWINTATEDGAYIIERDHSIWISHYAKRTPFSPKNGFSQLSPEDLGQFKKELDDMLSQNIPVYITKYGLLDKTDVFRKFMINNYRLEFVGGKMIEDWHLDCLKQVVVQNDLFKIQRQTE